MTQEELNEYNRLVDEYNRLVRQNRELAEEVELGIENCYVVAENMGIVGKDVVKSVSFLSGELKDAYDVVDDLHKCIIDVTEHYFLFKNLSEASKMLTKYNDEYYTKFKFYNELRRITLGYVIGMDSHIVSSETLRKKVEKSYLANTDYWLSYAIMAVMLWASDEQEAAYRAMNKALSMDSYKSCVFFMLVNLRFGRIDTARNWYLNLLDRTDVNNMTDEWQYVLHAYLLGAMKTDKEFTDMVSGYFGKMIDQTEATNVDFNKRIVERSKQFAASFIHQTENEFITLKSLSPDYPQMKQLLSSMEKIGAMAKYYDEIFQMEDDSASTIFEQIENVLYNLINSYDEKEFEIIKLIKRNEAVMAANGDMNVADQKFKERYGEMVKNKTFAELMLQWAFSEDYRQTNVSVKRFAISYLKERMEKGICQHFEEQKDQIAEKYKICLAARGGVEGMEFTCNENDYPTISKEIEKHYSKNKFRYIMSDTLFKVYLVLCVVSLVLLGIAGLTVGTGAFSVLLTLGITLGIVSGFLVWRRWVDLVKELTEKCRLTLVKFRKALEEMSAWRTLVNKASGAMQDLKNALERF